MFVVFGVFVLLRIPLNGNFIAALLTILGYSINDTVVIYDRIRENSALYGKKQMSLAELVNLSVNQSFARSLMTSITTCLALGVVCVVSVIYRLDSIYSFAFPLLFGNDTVVIYDRIRENSALYGKKQMSLAELVNLSVNQSFARSLMTSITTCLALGVVCVVSVIYRLDSIYSFAFPLLFGMVSGVYSTICIATPLWVDWKNKKKAAKKA